MRTAFRDAVIGRSPHLFETPAGPSVQAEESAQFFEGRERVADGDARASRGVF